MRALLALAACVALAACGLSIVGETTPAAEVDSGPPTSPPPGPTSTPAPEVDAGDVDATPPDAGPPAQVELSGVFDVDIVVNGPDGGPYDTGEQMDQQSNLYVTQTVATSLGSEPQRKGLPDDARFPADLNHAAVQLGWRNDADGANGKRFDTGKRDFEVQLPPGPFRRLVVYGASVQGNGDVDFNVRYTDGTESARQRIVFNDWDNPNPGSGSFSLVSKMDRARVNGTLDKDPKYSLWGGAVAVDLVKQTKNVLIHFDSNGVTKFYLLGVGLE